MTAPEQPIAERNQHCLMSPQVHTLQRAQRLLDQHAGHGYCAAYRVALEYSSEVLGG